MNDPLSTIDSVLLESILSGQNLDISLAAADLSTSTNSPVPNNSTVQLTNPPAEMNANIGQSSSPVSGCASQGMSITKWSECLPKFSIRIEDVLARGKVIEDWDCFINECAYHVIANGDMNNGNDYSEFGRAIITRYPCVSSTDGNNPWVSYADFFCLSLYGKAVSVSSFFC